MAECPTDHKHAAAHTCYTLHKCRCEACRNHRSATNRRRDRLHAYGRWVDPYVPMEPIREHVELLQAFGYGWKRIAELSGVGNTAMSQIIYGRKGSNSDPRKGETLKRIGREKAAKILAVKPDLELLRGGALIPSRGTVRRVQALVARGWSQSKIAARIGIDNTNMGTMLQRAQVTVATHRKVAALFDEIWDQDPPHAEHRDRIAYTRSLRYAKKRRWLPPLAWDDIDNDTEPPVPDEEVGVDEMAVDLAMAGELVRLSYDERRVAIRNLCAVKLSDQKIAERLHIADRTVLRIRQELGIPASLGADGQVAA